jgi:solute carrier family 35, member F5
LGLYFVNASLKFTTLGSSSILGATCSFFTLFFGSILKVERFTLIKGLAVLVTFVGVVINSLPGALKDSMSLGTQTWGNILALLGAICYATFLIFLQKQTTDKTGLNRSILFAFIGLFTMIFCWPIFIFLSLSKQETLELPPNATIFVFLVLKTVLGSVIPSYLWNVTFALTSPLYIAVGTSLTIPLNFVADHFMGNPVGWSEAIGALFVTAGCLIMNLAEIN